MIHRTFLFALAISASPLLAQAPPDGAPPKPPGEGGPNGHHHPMSPLMKALDADGDGVISAQEIANASAALKALDKNSDGKLTGEELRPARHEDGDRKGPGGPGGPGGKDRPPGNGAGGPPPAGANAPGKEGAANGPREGQRRRPRGEREGGPGHRPPPPLVSALDADHDGAISAEEMANAPTALKSLDKNGDGKLTEDELRPAPPADGPKGGKGGENPPPPPPAN